MSALITDSKIDPTFVMYDIVFGSRKRPYVSNGIVLRELATMGINMSFDDVDRTLRSWAADGRLYKRDGVFYIS